MSIFVNFLVAGCGAFFGGGVRKLLSDWLDGDDKPFPVGTFGANAVGSLLIGELTGMMNVFLATGFCGGLTTFSTFTLEVFKYFGKSKQNKAVCYWILSVVACIFCVYLGIWLDFMI